MASCRVVLLVGARLRGSASRSIEESRKISAPSASGESASPEMAMTGAPMRRKNGSRATTSAVLPLLLISSATSSWRTMPRSPCAASLDWRKKEGVPSDERVAAILRPMCPALPMPETTILPLQASSRRAACTSSGPKRSAARTSSSASCRSTWQPAASSSSSESFSGCRSDGSVMAGFIVRTSPGRQGRYRF